MKPTLSCNRIAKRNNIYSLKDEYTNVYRFLSSSDDECIKKCTTDFGQQLITN